MVKPTTGLETKVSRKVDVIGGTGVAQVLKRMAFALAFLLLFILSPVLVAAQAETPSPSPSPSASPKTQEEIDLEQEIKLLTLKKQAADLKKGIRENQPATSA